MAISKIQYDDKVAINIDSTIPDINKCNASDLNEIKSVVNNNADEIPTISDEYGTSTKDGYSQSYINGNTINPSGEPSTSEEDVSSASFTNTLEAPMNIDLKGNTLQNGTPTPSSPVPVNNVSGDNDIVVCGKNLCNLLDKTKTIATNMNVSVSNQIITFNGSWSGGGNWVEIDTKFSLGAGTYKLSKDTTISNFTISGMYDSISQTWISFTTADNFVLTLNNSVNITKVRGWTNGLGTLNNATYKIQIEQGNQATTYEAYNGTTYNIDLPVENLYDLPSEKTTTGITYSINDDNTINLSGTASANTTFMLYKDLANTGLVNGNTYTFSVNKSLPSGVEIRLEAYDGTTWKRHILGNVLSSSTSIITNTANLTDTTRVRYLVYVANGTSVNISNLGIQLEQGNKVNSFTPYGTTPIELNKIGTYQDYFYKENDKWYLHKEIGKITLNGSEEWVYSGKAIFTRITNARCLSNQNDDVGSGNIDYIICDNFSINGLGVIYTYGDIGITLFYMVNNPSEIRLTFGMGNISVNDFKTWLTNHNTIVYYEYQTPTNTEITYTPLINQLENIKNAMSKEGTTNINQINNDLPFILDLSVFNDTYNGRYESLVEQIPNNDNLVNVGTYVNDNYKVNMLYSHNLFDKDNANVLNAYIGTANGTIAALNNGRTIWIPIEANTTYTISKLKSARFVIATYTTQPALNVSGTNVAYDNDATSLTITSGANDKYLAVWLYNSDVDTLTYQQLADSLMINEGSEALPYEPYLTPSINVDGEEIYNKQIIKQMNVSGTTSALGNIGLTLDKNKNVPISANINNGNAMGNFYAYQDNNNWILHCSNLNTGEATSNVSINAIVYYIEL